MGPGSTGSGRRVGESPREREAAIDDRRRRNDLVDEPEHKRARSVDDARRTGQAEPSELVRCKAVCETRPEAAGTAFAAQPVGEPRAGCCEHKRCTRDDGEIRAYDETSDSDDQRNREAQLNIGGVDMFLHGGEVSSQWSDHQGANPPAQSHLPEASELLEGFPADVKWTAVWGAKRSGSCGNRQSPDLCRARWHGRARSLSGAGRERVPRRRSSRSPPPCRRGRCRSWRGGSRRRSRSTGACRAPPTPPAGCPAPRRRPSRR